MDHASELRGILVVASEEGAQLGTLSAIYIDPLKRSIAAFGYRTRRLGGDEFFIPIDEVQTVGKDVVLISRESAAHKISDENEPPGRSLSDLQGAWVTTMEGHHLGTLVDLDFSPDWKISELSLADDRRLDVRPEDLQIGDAILVPASYADEVQESKETTVRGFLRRILGRDSVEGTKAALKRATRGSDERPHAAEESRPTP